MGAKQLIFYLASVLILLALVTLLKGWFDLSVVTFWVGGLIGVFLPEIDHLIYAYVLRPHEYDSQRMQRMINQGQVAQSVQMGAETREQRTTLVFHTITFQLIFVLFAIFVVSSTGSLLGRGLVLGFLLNLVVDQGLDLQKTSALENWFGQLKLNLTREQAVFYVLGNLLVIIVLAFFL